VSPLAAAARSISSTVAGRLTRVARGQVAAAFARSCYLDLDGRVVALVAPELLNGPLNIVLDAVPRAAFAQLAAGQPVRASRSQVAIADILTVTLEGARPWSPGLPRLRRAEARELRAALDVVKAVLASAPAESVAHAASRTARAAEGMDALYSGVRRGDAAMLAHAARCLCGLGPGLTPSGDDVLAGLLVALALLQPPYAPEARETILAAARDRTTRVSLAYLEAAARGEAGEAWHLLVEQLDRRGDHPRAVAPAAQRVMAAGETSGADMLTGFVLGMEGLLPG